MRDIFNELFQSEPLDPIKAARRGLRAPLRRRFYREVSVAEGDGSFALRLDGRPVRTPARRMLAAPTSALADMLAAEWRAQTEFITPSAMPLTRLANSIIDGVAEKLELVADEVAGYIATDLVLYRATSPQGLVARQAAAWDPIVDWARDALDADFVVGEGLSYVKQSESALMAARTAIPRTAADARALWQLGALHSITTLTGSALTALALLRGHLTVQQGWTAAHVDEDWNMDQWGLDETALERRAYHFAEMQVAATVLAALRGG